MNTLKNKKYNMKYLNKYNENNSQMKQFVLTTTSESSDHYIYFIEHPQMPTREELNKFLVEQGSDVSDGESYEDIDMCVEINNFKRI
jgi:hypothetical protein